MKKLQIPKLKISIRLSILSFVLILLMSVSAFIILINYFALNSVLITSANNILTYSSEKVSEQINDLLEPLNDKTSTVYYMMRSGLIQPANSSKFYEFLHSIIIDEKNISGAYWGDTAGNLYWLNKNSDNTFAEKAVLNNNGEKVTIKKTFDLEMKLLAVHEASYDNIDPRIRPWYQKAELKKEKVWVVYKFLQAGSEAPQLGVTAALPFYDNDGNLLGVFGVDMLIDTITQYIDKIKFTKNSKILVVDDDKNLISLSGDNKLVFDDTLPRIYDLPFPAVEKSFKAFKQNKISPFSYKTQNGEYISAYKRIEEAKGDSAWYVAIITPINDIILPLKKSMSQALIFVGLVLILGIFVAAFFSASLSRPIRKLAQDSEWICQLRLDEIKETFSWIREIADMGKAFTKMKNVLQSFELYMPVTLVRKLIASNKVAAVGGELKELTIVFTDIQNFTRMSEVIHPAELMQYLSRYFEVITKVVIQMDGTVDKYIGDGLMAFWGAPTEDFNHSLHACQAALQIKHALFQLNEEWRINGKPTVKTSIGVNTGNVIVGNVGSGDRLNYTALGDSVNLASRVEGLNRLYETSIIVSEFTYRYLKDKFKFRLLDRVATKGKKQGVYVYELVGDLSAGNDLELEAYNSEFYEAFSYYERGEWQVGLDLFNKLSKKYPDDEVIKIFIKRCSDFLANPPPVWDGVWILTEK